MAVQNFADFLKMGDKKVHLRHCLLYEFDREMTPAKAAENICQIYGIDAVTERTCRRWFAKFREGAAASKMNPDLAGQ